MDYAGLIGAVLGFALGMVEYQVASRIVIGGLRRTDRSKTPAEREDFERRIRLLRAAMVVLMIGGMPILGYVIGRTVFGGEL